MSIMNIVTEDANEMKHTLDLYQGKMEAFSPCYLTELQFTSTKKVDFRLSVFGLFLGPPDTH